jgi:hypothetical protein
MAKTKEINMKKTIKSSDYKNVYADFTVVVDPEASFGRPPAMAILVEPVRGAKFLLPMDMKNGRDLGYVLLRTVLRAAPGAFPEEALNDAGPKGECLRAKLADGGLSYEEFWRLFSDGPRLRLDHCQR